MTEKKMARAVHYVYRNYFLNQMIFQVTHDKFTQEN